MTAPFVSGSSFARALSPLASGTRPRATRPGVPILQQFLAAGIVAVIAAALSYLLITHSAVVGIGAVIAVLGAAWFATTQRVNLALALLMLYLGLCDGYLKLASGSSMATFVRDVLLYALVAGLLIRATARRTPLPLPPLSTWVALFAVLVLVQLFNPGNGTIVHSLAGLRQSLEFVPLFFLTYAYVRTKRALRVFVILLLVIAAANSAVNWIQFHLSPDQLAAWGPGYAQRINGTGFFEGGARVFTDAYGGVHVRPFGLGSDAGAGGLVTAFAVGALLAFAARFRRVRYLVAAVLLAVIMTIGIVTSEGRAAIVVSLVVALGYTFMVAGGHGRSTVLFGTALAVAAAAFVAHSVLTTAGSLDFRYHGLSTSGILQTAQQSRGASFAAIPYNMIHFPLGGGLGTGGPAAAQPGAPAAAGANTETEFSFAVLETGIPGMLTVVGFTGAIFLIGLTRCRNEPDPEARLLLAAILAPTLGMLVLYTVSAATPTTPTGPYLWASGGIAAYWLMTRQAELRAASRPPAEGLEPGAAALVGSSSA